MFGSVRAGPSSTGAAINPDRLNICEGRYLRESAAAIYRRGPQVTKYGLKTHPNDPALEWLKKV